MVTHNLKTFGRRYGNSEEEVTDSLYFDESGQIVFPARNIISGMAQRARYFGRNTYHYSELVRKGLFISPELIPIEPPNYKILDTYVKENGDYVMRSRPIFPEWKMAFNLIITDPRLSPVDMHEILKDLGSFGGIGDYRQEYGRFSIKKFRRDVDE